jgi:PPK2 family polyphosphate:nucleotide phosphotransferase
MDTSGKDGVINRAISGFNAQGVRVIPFKVPTKEEADHDFLWRIHGETPAKGEIVIFNRSHYEDVLFPRVHGLIDDDEVKHRYEHINMFEQLLARQGTTILKFFLHISNAKQKDRLQERIDDPSKNWKISEADFKERVHWNKYMRAYEDAINATNTKYAKWNVIPANSKWFRNLCVARIVLKTMENLKMESPKPIKSLKGVSVE